MKAVITVKAANGTNAMEFTSFDELGQMTALFDERGTSYSVKFIKEKTLNDE